MVIRMLKKLSDNFNNIKKNRNHKKELVRNEEYNN